MLAEVAEGFKEDVDAAVEAASRAFASGSEWRNMTAAQRASLLYKLADRIESDIQYIAVRDRIAIKRLFSHHERFKLFNFDSFLVI